MIFFEKMFLIKIFKVIQALKKKKSYVLNTDIISYTQQISHVGEQYWFLHDGFHFWGKLEGAVIGT